MILVELSTSLHLTCRAECEFRKQGSYPFQGTQRRDLELCLQGDEAFNDEDEYHKASIEEGTWSLDYTFLHKIIKRRAASALSSDKPSPDTLVIHLRLGDVVDAVIESVEELLLSQHFFYRENNTEPWNAKPDSEELVAPW